MKVILVHPMEMPCLRNRAVFQRPFELSRKHELHIVTMIGKKICHDIFDYAHKIYYFGNSLVVWKLKTALFLLKNKYSRKNTIIYAFPQWGWLLLLFLKVIGYRLVVDMQHTPYYMYFYNRIVKLSLLKKAMYKMYGLYFILIAKIVLKRMDLVVVMSHSIKTGFAKLLRYNFSVKDKHILAIPNGVLVNENCTVERKSTNTVYICYAGNIQSSKLQNIFVLIETLRKNDYNCVAYIAGNVPKYFINEFKRIVNSNDSIKYVGFISHDSLIKLYKKCHFGYFSVNTGFIDHKHSHPGKVFEYMHYGCIPIVTKIPSLEEFLKDMKNSIFIDNMLESKILKVVSNNHLQNEIRQSAFNTSLKYNWKDLNSILMSKIEKYFSA